MSTPGRDPVQVSPSVHTPVVQWKRSVLAEAGGSIGIWHFFPSLEAYVDGRREMVGLASDGSPARLAGPAPVAAPWPARRPWATIAATEPSS